MIVKHMQYPIFEAVVPNNSVDHIQIFNILLPDNLNTIIKNIYNEYIIIEYTIQERVNGTDTNGNC